MNLKENFIKSLEVLLKNEPEGRIVENYKTYECICNPEDEKTCDKECQQCRHCVKFTVDVALIDVGETEYYYYFKNSKNENKLGRNIISSYEKMYKILNYLNQYVIGDEIKSDIRYSKKIESLQIYANDFFKKICDECFPLLDSSILPIRFHVYAKNFTDYKNPKQTAGQYVRKGDQLIIDLYYCLTMDVKDLERNIRHEVLHYALATSNCSHEDDAGIFHALCKVYDAGAYKEMDQEQQKYYDFFFKIYDIMPSELKFAVSTIGSKDEVITENRNKLVEIIESNKSPEFVKDCLDMKNSYKVPDHQKGVPAQMGVSVR